MDWTAIPPLSALRAFAAYAEHRSVEQAGNALNVSHAAISQQIRNLETHLGFALLDRHGRRMTLTPDGERLAEALLDGFGGIARTLAEMTGRDAGRALEISATPGFAATWLMPRLPGFRERHPSLSLAIDPSSQLRSLQPGGLDVAIRYGDGNWPGLEAERLFLSPIVVVAAPALVPRPITDPAELRAYPWLQELGTSEATDWLAEYGVTPDTAHGMTGLPGNLMIEAARQGQGIAITARLFVEQDLVAGRLRLLFQDARQKGYWMVTRPGIPRPPLRHFVSWLRREAAKASSPI
ncbi:LysR family transcriptional regulator [Citreicella sp. C3M06]|uniref:LysR family transcriptional regulator n=1 Tax=Citreicella sp. C3M06 TaxID=2841564 RepID=UPI001C09DAAD|nr:LysR family transcriptional regulator [Citreicella sp. C3M06]MBU2962565.1 LysR family transcriptional regulator [Citreicella sp. C3M06]